MGSNVALDISGAAICGGVDERNPLISLPNQSSDRPLLALDIGGGTLIKLVYFSADEESNSGAQGSGPARGGKLNFVKFETRQLDECLDFIQSKQLLHRSGSAEVSSDINMTIMATGGGAYKFGHIFKGKLGVGLDKLDEMDSIVAGANFLLKEVLRYLRT